jgi:hypothetical protein
MGVIHSHIENKITPKEEIVFNINQHRDLTEPENEIISSREQHIELLESERSTNPLHYRYGKPDDVIYTDKMKQTFITEKKSTTILLPYIKLQCIPKNILTPKIKYQLKYLLGYDKATKCYIIPFNERLFNKYLKPYILYNNNNMEVISYKISVYVNKQYKVYRGLPIILKELISNDTIDILLDHGYSIINKHVILSASKLNEYFIERYGHNWMNMYGMLTEMEYIKYRVFIYIINQLIQLDNLYYL